MTPRSSTPSRHQRRARSASVARIGFLFTDPISDPVVADSIEAFRLGLSDGGYLEGENVVFELRSADGRPERLPELAAALVAMGPEVILASHNQAAARLKDATRTIPLVIVGVELSALGITDLAHRGANITGIGIGAGDDGEASVTAMRLRLLKEAVPGVSRVSVLWDPVRGASELSELWYAALQTGTQLELIEVRGGDAFDASLAAAVACHADAIMVLARALALPRAKEIAEFALEAGLPSMHSGREFVVAGGLMSYHEDSWTSWRRAAAYVDRILKGADPGTLPMERSADCRGLVLNGCTATELVIAFPRSVLTQASEMVRCGATS